MLNLKKEYLKLQQKSCEEKLKKILDLKSRQISLETAKHNEFVWKLQSNFDLLINKIRIELRAINLVRAYLRCDTRDSVEHTRHKQTKLENTLLVAKMVDLIHGPLYINQSSWIVKKLLKWLQLQESELLKF